MSCLIRNGIEMFIVKTEKVYRGCLGRSFKRYRYLVWQEESIQIEAKKQCLSLQRIELVCSLCEALQFACTS